MTEPQVQETKAAEFDWSKWALGLVGVASTVKSARKAIEGAFEDYLRLLKECCRCQNCGHVQAEPNWCHECRHRVQMPDWAKHLIDENSRAMDMKFEAEGKLEELRSGLRRLAEDE